MGLDMYLEARKYVSHYSHVDDPQYSTEKTRAEAKAFDDLVESVGLSGVIDSRSPAATVGVNVAYWRKANAIHDWFVTNVQRGIDDCREAWVTRDQLRQLLDVVQKSLESRDASLLPPVSGFFFGSTEVDDYYWQDLQYTEEALTRVLNAEELADWDFYYQSSW